jgi:hypothetical protein
MSKPSADEADASPTKQFVVPMLTRDINLADAFLDLVDNCLDGALGASREVGVRPPLAGQFSATIEL